MNEKKLYSGDAGLRKLERDSSSELDPEVRASLLQKKLRGGELKPEQLSLAAKFGDTVATEVAGCEATELDEGFSLSSWLEDLGEGLNDSVLKELFVRIGFATLLDAESVSTDDFTTKKMANDTAKLARQFLSDPDLHSEDIASLLVSIDEVIMDNSVWFTFTDAEQSLLGIARALLSTMSSEEGKDIMNQFSLMVTQRKHFLSEMETASGGIIGLHNDSSYVKNVLGTNLLPWIFQEGDPLIQERNA